MNSKLTLYEELELLPANSLKPTLRVKLAWGLHYLMGQLVRTLVMTSEPHITLRCSPDGERRFNGYDPVTHQRIQGVSEADLRIWLGPRQEGSDRDLRLWLELRHW